MTLRWNKRVIEQAASGPDVDAAMLDLGWSIAVDAASRAPVRAINSEGGAKSIAAVLFRSRRLGNEVRVSWDRRHFYMSFQEFGTVKSPARPFLRPAAHRYL